MKKILEKDKNKNKNKNNKNKKELHLSKDILTKSEIEYFALEYLALTALGYVKTQRLPQN